MIRLGFAILAVVALIAYAICHDIGYTLVAVCVALVLLPPSIDPAIQIKQRQLEHDCPNCLLCARGETAKCSDYQRAYGDHR